MRSQLNFFLVFSFLVAGIYVPAFSGPRDSVSDRIQADELEPDQVAPFMEQFRSMRIEGDFVWIIELEYMPRRGKSIRYDGIYFGSWNNGAPVNRVILLPNKNLEKRKEFIFHNGASPRAWSIEDGKIGAISEEDWLKELIPGIVYRPFDILMPFIYWENYTYLGTDKVKSRPVQRFQMNKPQAAPDLWPDSVVASIDDDYQAMVESEMISGGVVQKTFKIISYKKVQDHWIVKSTDLVDETTGDKTRMRVVEAAMGQKLGSSIFDPTQISKPLPILEGGSFEKL